MNILIAYPLLLHTKVSHGSGVRILRLLHTLTGQGHTIYLMCRAEMDIAPYEADILPLREMCQEYQIFRPRVLTKLEKARDFIMSSIPPQAQTAIIPEAMGYVQELTASGKVDIAYIVFTAMGEYAKVVDTFRCRVIVDADDFGTRHLALKLQTPLRPLERVLTWITWLRTAKYEKELLSQVDLTLAITDQEKEHILALAPSAHVEVIPLLLDMDQFQGASSDVKSGEKSDVQPDTILFFGSFGHHPNRDAAVWFCDSIFPEILKSYPTARLLIVGRYSCERVGHLASEHVQVIGEVDDMRDWLAKAAVVVSPIRAGGARVKSLETLAAGRPLVTTALGAEGLSGTAGEHFIVADDVAEFARAVVRVLEDENLRIRLGNQGQSAVATYHDIPVVGAKVDKALRTLLSDGISETDA